MLDPQQKQPQQYWGTASSYKIGKIYDALANVIEPKSDLDFDDPFQLLIAVILSAQATDKSVNQATDRLYPVAGTPETILALGVEGLLPYIKHIGLAPTKAKNVIKTCAILLDRHQGKVPADRASLEALPGLVEKRRMSCSILPLGSQQLLLIRTSIVWPIACTLLPVLRRIRPSASCWRAPRKGTCSMHIII